MMSGPRKVFVLRMMFVSLAASVGLASLAGGQDEARPVRVAEILAAPEAFEGLQVVIRGTVLRAKREVFPNGRPYYTLSVADGPAVVTVFSWTRPAIGDGDRIEAAGVFHVWRYNIRHMVAASRISRLERDP